jgi:SSS family solute:Na+ symporter
MNIFWLVTVIICYIATVSFLGYKGYVNTKTNIDYMVGGRNAHPYVMAMSYGAAFISTSAIVGFGGSAALFGMSLLWLTVCNVFVGIFIAFVFYGKKTRKMGLNLDAHTFPELLGRRLDSVFVQKFAGIVIFIFMPLYAAAVLIGASRIIEGLLGIPYIYAVSIFTVLVAAYVIMGGLKGVMYTDALQGSLMLFGMIFLLVMIYVKLGGVYSGHTALTALSKMVPESLAAIGHSGWTASPSAGSPLWWIVYSSLVLCVGIGVLAQPQLVVRYMTVKSGRELNRAIGIGGIFILVTVGTAFIVGSLSNVYFMENFGKLSIQMAEGNSDKVIPIFIREAMPVWFGYVFMLVILSVQWLKFKCELHSL